MTLPVLTLLDRFPLSEIRRRARVLELLSETPATSIPGGDLVRWESWGGDHASWVFAVDGRALLLVFDHESVLNLYSEGDVEAQEAMYAGVPADLVALVRGLPDEEPFLMLGTCNQTLPAASGVCWFDGAAWHTAAGLEALVAERHLDLARDSGLNYCTSWLLLDQAFITETLLAAGAEDRYGVDAAELAAVISTAEAS